MKFVPFCSDVLRVRLTPAQRVLALVAIDGVEPGSLTGDERDLARHLFGDVETIPEQARAVLVAVCGARSGKSRILCALYSLWRALLADLSGLAPGEQATALIVAPDLRLARQTLRFVAGAAKDVRSIAPLVESEAAESLMLRRPDDGRAVAIECLPATRGGSALRGRSLVSACLDEAAFFRDESFSVNDIEVFRAVAPRVLPGGLVVVASTPWAESGLLYDEFAANHSAPRTAIAAHAPTLLMNPSKAPEVARERERDPENARREFDAEFMAMGSGLFFDQHAIDRALALGDAVVGQPAGQGSIGGDLGLVRDASAFVALHDSGVFLDVRDILELRPSKGAPLRLSEVCKAGAAFAVSHRADTIHVDHHVLEPAREHMPEAVTLLPVEGGQNAKAERFVTVRNLLNEGRIRIPRQFMPLANQLREVVSRPTAGGGLQISLPRRAGVHGDVSAAFVLAAHAAAGGACEVFDVAELAEVLDPDEARILDALRAQEGASLVERAGMRILGSGFF
jgi:hypothetical protein